jgi:CHAT domain-containing protein
MALLLATTLSRSTGPEIPTLDSFERAKYFAWLDNWAEASRLLDQLKRSGRLPDNGATRLLDRAVGIRGNIESLPLPSSAEALGAMASSEIARKNPGVRLQILAMQGDVEFQYDLAAAEKTWTEVCQLASSLGQRRWAARAEGELGTIAFLKGESFTALKMVSEAYLKAEISGDIAAQIKQLTALGEGLAEFGRPADAIRFFNKALALWSQNRDVYFPFTAYLGKARILLTTLQASQGRQMLATGLEQAQRDGMRIRETRILTVLGDDAVRGGDRESALKWLTSAAEIAKGAGLDRSEAEVDSKLASVLSNTGDVDRAATYAKLSVAAAERAGDRYHLPQRLAALAAIETRRGELSAAEAAYAHATQIVDSLFTDLPNLRHENTVVATMARVFQGHFELTLNGFHDFDRSFDILESARARGLVDRIRKRQIAEQTDRPGDPQMLQRIADLNRELATENDPTSRKRLLERLWEAEIRSLRLGRSNIAADSPVETKPISLRQLQSILRDDDLLVEYVLGESRSFALAVTRFQAVPYQLAGRRAIESAIATHLRAIRNRSDGRPEAAAIYNLLLGPIKLVGQYKRIIIVPDGTLDTVPFGATVDPHGRYLVETHVISYAPSATALVLLSTPKPEQQESVELLGVGGASYAIPHGSVLTELRAIGLFNPSAPPRFSALPHSFTEVVDLPSDAGWDPRLLVGDAATEANLKSLPLARYNVLHFALHSAIDHDFPDRSGLVFTSHSNDEDDDLLQAREIRELRLNADLVTLSACEAAAGTTEGIAGTNSLVQSFLIAGARSVVASIWDADDTFTAALMERFYANLRLGHDKAEALTLAKREMLKLYGPNAAPLYWAGFRIVGDAHGTIAGDQSFARAQ